MKKTKAFLIGFCAFLILIGLASVANSQEYYELWISASEGGTTNPAPGSYMCLPGTRFSVTAIADAGWQFSHWELDNLNVDGGATIVVVMNAGHSLTAVFVKQASAFNEWGLVLFTLAVAGLLGFMILRRRRAVVRAQ